MSSGIYNRYTGYHNRQSIRLRGYDYSRPGRYFVTICIHDRKRRLFGDIVGGEMVFNEFGRIAYNEFARLPGRFPNMKLEDFQIMPNHVHAVIPIAPVGGAPARGAPTGATTGATTVVSSDFSPIIPVGPAVPVGAELAPAPTGTKTLGDIVGAYKSLVATEFLKIYKSRNERMGKLWQRNYYDHIIAMIPRCISFANISARTRCGGLAI